LTVALPSVFPLPPAFAFPPTFFSSFFPVVKTTFPGWLPPGPEQKQKIFYPCVLFVHYLFLFFLFNIILT
jgi:hypothetical protein